MAVGQVEPNKESAFKCELHYPHNPKSDEGFLFFSVEVIIKPKEE